MKSICLFLGGILIAMNLLFGLLLSSYSIFNMWLNTSILAITAAFVLVIHSIRLREAIKISFTILLSVSGFIKLLLGFIAPEHIEDNWCVIGCIILTAIEIIMILSYHKMSMIDSQ